jgi:tetratricopeptide (TPR) repeat protein
MSRGDIETAMTHFTKYLDYLELNAQKSMRLIKSYEEAGNLCLSYGRYNQALKFFKRGLRILLTTWGNQHALVSEFMNSIGFCYYGLGQFEKA